MNKRFLPYCIDINTEHCPCLLAETNNCVFCSHLKGEAVCNCNWTGTCIYYEKEWQSNNKKLTGSSPRQEVDATQEGKMEIGLRTYMLELAVPASMAQELDKPGAYVFLRRAGDPAYCSFPVGVMNVRENKLQLVIEAIGPKSVRAMASDDAITVRGPYSNGIFGQPWIDNTKAGNVVLVTGGMGQPPAMPIARKLINNSCHVTAIVAPGQVGQCFITPWLQKLGISVTEVPSLRRNGMPLLRELLAGKANFRPDMIVSAGPDEQHYGVIAAMQAEQVNLPMAATNNATMCCGEGICGSCEKVTCDNKKIKTCKIQTDFTQLMSD